MIQIPTLTMDDEIRFWSKAIRKSPDDCWIWIGSCTGNTESRRRPTFKIKDTNFIAARIAWAITHKQDPGDLLVCHSCEPDFGKRQLCVNPGHLWLGTHSDNSQDAADKGQLSTTNRSRLTPNDVDRIRYLHDELGMAPSEIGKMYNLTRQQIWRIVTRRSFA